MNKNIVIFASGRGSNAQALYTACQDGQINGTIVALVVDRSDAQIIAKAQAWAVPVLIVEPKKFVSKEKFEKEILEFIEPYKPDLLCLAGYIRLIGKTLIEAYTGRIINIHPSLLPAFKGLAAQKQAIDAGIKISGCTVHFVDAGMDTGPIITQTAVNVYDEDTEETLTARILGEEHRAYVRACAAFCRGQLSIQGSKVIGLHGREQD